jgi:hypothetical protein
MSEPPDGARRGDWSPPRFDLGGETTAPRPAPPTPRGTPAPAAVPRVPGQRGAGPRRLSATRRNTATLLALLFLIAAALGFILLTAIVLPAFLGVVAVVMGLFAFGTLHYVLWGFWLGGGSPDAEDDATAPE